MSRADGKAAPLGREECLFRRRLLKWYRAHGRSLPWRETDDPYRILVSEVMLQQTQVDRVVPKYREFLKKYPTVEALASADPDEVRAAWSPLGYNIRPYRLHGVAREAVARYGGKIPNNPQALLNLKGIGRYTAGAVLSFAYNRKTPILDTNVARLLYRVFVADGDLRRAKIRNRLWELAGGLIPRGKARVFNSALMDFGAMVCKARAPLCAECPLSDICKTYPMLKET